MYELIKNPEAILAAKRPANIEYHCVFDTVKETGAHHFLHGVAVEQWGGQLAVCFAFNDNLENSITEQLVIRWSGDGGNTWTNPQVIAHSDSYANSHSVFLPQDDALWCFGPRFLGLGERPRTKKEHLGIQFKNLQTEAWKFDGQSWQATGLVGSDFWPLGAPVKMDNGSWIMSGCDTNWMAAIAISRGDDLTHWDVVKPDTDGDVFTEAGAWVSANKVFLVMRNGTAMTDGKYHAAVALSEDFGKTFSPCTLSNLPMSTTKPFCGHLNDGRPFLVFNQSVAGSPHDRSRLLLGVGEKGTFQIDRVYLIDEGQPTDSDRRLMLSYPYAKQFGDKLYIAYSYESAPGKNANNNDAMLAVVRLDSLT